MKQYIYIYIYNQFLDLKIVSEYSNQNEVKIWPSSHSSSKIQDIYKQQDSFNKIHNMTIFLFLFFLLDTISQSYQQQKITINNFKKKKKKTQIPSRLRLVQIKTKQSVIY